MSIASRDSRPKEVICFVAINTHGSHMCSVKTDGILSPGSFTLDGQTDLHIFSNASIGNVNFAESGENYRETLAKLEDTIERDGEIKIKEMTNILLRRKAKIKQEMTGSSTPFHDFDPDMIRFMKDDYLYYQYAPQWGYVSNKMYEYNSNNEKNFAIYLLFTFTKYNHEDSYDMNIIKEDITKNLHFTGDPNRSLSLNILIENIKTILDISARRGDKLTIILIDDSCDTLSSARSTGPIDDRTKRAHTRSTKVKIPRKLKYQNKLPIEETLKKISSRKRPRHETSLGGAKKHKKRKTQKKRHKRYL
jgi:hypothetical protein